MDGSLVIDKPAGSTSHDVVVAVRRLLGEKRIGHLGTLDPFATGVLVLLVGRATRLARFYDKRRKTYQGVIRFGYATDTMDGTGTPISGDTAPILKEVELSRAFAEFVGPYEQRPPAFSAKKISGVPAYRFARKGLPVKLSAVPVVIHALKLKWVNGTRAGFQTTVSSGTYVRSLVNDIGERLQVGAHLAELRRTSVGEFEERNALKLEELQARWVEGGEVTIPLRNLLPELPRVDLEESEANRARHGSNLMLPMSEDRVRLMDPRGNLIGIAERIEENLYHPVVVLITDCGGLSAATPSAGGSSSDGMPPLKTMLVL